MKPDSLMIESAATGVRNTQLRDTQPFVIFGYRKVLPGAVIGPAAVPGGVRRPVARICSHTALITGAVASERPGRGRAAVRCISDI